MAGEIGMSADLDNLSQCMFNGFVPGGWMKKSTSVYEEFGQLD